MAKDNYIREAWLVLMLALGFGAVLALVDSRLSQRISQNRLDKTMDQIPSLVPGSVRGERVEVEGERLYRAVDADGRTLGWVMPASGAGFADRIELLVGLDAAGETITGVYVLEQKETPGLGNRITDAGWRDLFTGKSAELIPLRVKRGKAEAEREIESITGATISSDSVVGIVNNAVQRMRSLALREEEG